MPTYEYHCSACGHEFEQFQSIKADPVRKCPSCGKLKVVRKIGLGGGVLFKGSGFYETDYRSESYSKAAEADREKPSTSDSAGSSKGAASDAPSGPTKPDAPASGSSKDASKPASSPTTAPASEPTSSPSKATHPSRVGRGAGNIVHNPPKPREGSKPQAKPPIRKSSGKGQGPKR